MPHISLAAEKIGRIWSLPVTNSLLSTYIVMAILIIVAYLVSRQISLVPGRLQSVFEIIIGGLYDLFGNINGKHIKMVFPLLASLFLFIIISNWFGLLPGVGTIGFYESEKTVNNGTTDAESHIVKNSVTADVMDKNLSDTGLPDEPDPAETEMKNEIDQNTQIHDQNRETVKTGETVKEKPENVKEEAHGRKFTPFFRGGTADINGTLALAIVTVMLIQYYGFVAAGPFYALRFFDYRNPINLFIGLLEIVSDVSKIISFAFRLFGNIFAGEVLLAVMAFLMPFIAPLPFLMLELFVGFIQALVFSMLSAVFLNVAIAHGEHEAHAFKEAKNKKH